MKLYEYLAAGVPIGATDIPATEEFADTVWIARDPDAFSQALSADAPERRRRQRHWRKKRPWDQRIETLSAAIEAHSASNKRL